MTEMESSNMHACAQVKRLHTASVSVVAGHDHDREMGVPVFRDMMPPSSTTFHRELTRPSVQKLGFVRSVMEKTQAPGYEPCDTKRSRTNAAR